jgi:hypothetical protein
MSTSSTPLRRSTRLAPASTAPPPPSRAELARQRNAKARATKPERPHFVVVEKPRSFDVIKYPLGGYSPDDAHDDVALDNATRRRMGPFGVTTTDKDFLPDALAAAAMQKHGTTQRSAVSSPAKLRVLCAAENKILTQKQALERLTVVQLKSKLNNYCLTTTGKKAQLVQRMLAFEIMFDNDVVMFGGVSRYSG